MIGPQQQRRIVLLTGKREGPYLRRFLRTCNPDLRVDVAESLTDLEKLIGPDLVYSRILSFLSGLIIPQEILCRLMITPYNIHPGPPEFPGSHPESFAIWQRAEFYGVTVHEMIEKVDEGPIVATDTFVLAPHFSRENLAELTYTRAIEAFRSIGAFCAFSDANIEHSGHVWSGRKTTKADFRKLCCSGKGLSDFDLQRLKRACGEDYLPTELKEHEPFLTSEL